MAAQMGTVMYLETWKSCRLSAMPANSAITLVKFNNTSVDIIRKVVRRPYSSLIRSLRPLPVTAPMRAHISWMTTRAMVIGMRLQRSLYPNWAPADEYTQMPPASLSTFAVIKPGPMTASRSRVRVFQCLSHFIGRIHRELNHAGRINPELRERQQPEQRKFRLFKYFAIHRTCHPLAWIFGTMSRRISNYGNYKLWQFWQSRSLICPEVATPRCGCAAG